MDRLQSMRVFVRVVEAGSFTKASAALHMPRATVSIGLQELETHLGTRLLNRTTRRLSLTPEGTAYFERCQRLLEDMEELDSLFRHDKLPPTGRLKIDVPGRLARLVIAPALPQFFDRFPDIELEMGVTDRPIDLVQEGVDCVLRVGDVQESRLVARRLGQMRQGNFASPDYLARFGVPHSIEDLRGHCVINYVSPLNGQITDWAYSQEGGRRTLRLPSKVFANNTESYVACAIAGLGLIQLPVQDLTVEISTGCLVEILPAFPPPSLPVSLLLPHRSYRSRKVQAFVEWISELFTERRLLEP